MRGTARARGLPAVVVDAPEHEVQRGGREARCERGGGLAGQLLADGPAATENWSVKNTHSWWQWEVPDTRDLAVWINQNG